MVEKQDKAFENQEQRRAHSIRNPKWGPPRGSGNNYTQQPRHTIGIPSTGQSWPMQPQWQATINLSWPIQPTWQSFGQPPMSQAWPNYPSWQSAGPPPMGQAWPNHPPWQSVGPPPMSQAWPTQPAYPHSMQFQEPPLVNEQALREFHRLHQYNTEQSHRQHQYNTEQGLRQLQSLFMMPQAQSSGYVQPISHVQSYSPRAQSQFHGGTSVTGVQDTIPMPNLKRKASTEMAKKAKKASGDTHAMQSQHQNPVVNDASGSQRPAGNTAEPQWSTDDMQSKHQNLVMNDATETQRLVGKATKPQQSTRTTQSKHQDLVVNDASESQRLVDNAAEPQRETDTAPLLMTTSPAKSGPRPLLRGEYETVIKTFHAYGSDTVWLGKNTRYACSITEEQLKPFKRGTWYAADSFVIYRCVMDVPENFIFVTPDESHDQQKISKVTTDLIWVYLTSGNHWTMVHLSMNRWRITYHDSMMDQDEAANYEHNMKFWCDKAIDDVRRRQRDQSVTLPDETPQMERTCTIQQRDRYSCGPFALREIERLMNMSIEDDLEDPVRIKLRHLAAIHQLMKHRTMNKDPDEPSKIFGATSSVDTQTQKQKWNTEAIAKAKILPETSITLPNPSPSPNAGTPISTNPETFILADLTETPVTSISQATTKRSSPKLEYRNVCLKALNDENRMSKSNPHLPNSLLDKSLPKPPLSNMSEKDTPPPGPLEETDDSEEVQSASLSSGQILIVGEHPKMRTSKMLRELASTLKVADEMPKKRPKPQYANCFPVHVPGIEDDDEDPSNASYETRTP